MQHRIIDGVIRDGLAYDLNGKLIGKPIGPAQFTGPLCHPGAEIRFNQRQARCSRCGKFLGLWR